MTRGKGSHPTSFVQHQTTFQNYSPLQNALRRWLDQCAGNVVLRQNVEALGLPRSLSKVTHETIYRARDCAFSTGKKLERTYGPVENLRLYARATGWQQLLDHMLSIGLADPAKQGSHSLLRGADLPIDARTRIQDLALQQATLEWLGLPIGSGDSDEL